MKDFIYEQQEYQLNATLNHIVCADKIIFKGNEKTI